MNRGDTLRFLEARQEKRVLMQFDFRRRKSFVADSYKAFVPPHGVILLRASE
jgi:hypothetical protein